MIVIVEVPHLPSGAPADQVVVNLSGPAAGVCVEIIDAYGRTMLASALVDAIHDACGGWPAGTSGLSAKGEQLRELTERLLQLSTNAELPASVATDISRWHDQLYAAWQWWDRDGDVRGLGRAEGIIGAMQGWASSLRIHFEEDAAPGCGGLA